MASAACWAMPVMISSRRARKRKSARGFFDEHHAVEIILHCDRNGEQERAGVAQIDFLIRVE